MLLINVLTGNPDLNVTKVMCLFGTCVQVMLYFTLIIGLFEALGRFPRRIPAYSLSTQVSLEPPPCDEFTIRLPRCKATRVSPPLSTNSLSLPITVYVLKSI